MSRGIRIFPPLALLAGLLALPPLPARADIHPNTEGGVAVDRAFQVGEIDNINLFNGSLTLTIPLGLRYPVGGSLSYGLTLVYNSNPWYFFDDASTAPTVYTEGVPSPCSNAGLGWRVSLGRLDPRCVAVDENAVDPQHHVYEGPDGSEHIFYATLHEGDPVVAGVVYTRDGTYLRLRDAAGGEHDLDFPDGTTHHFLADGRLAMIQDGFGNQVSVAYGTLVWTISDSQNRTQKIYFRGDLPNYPETVDRVVLSGLAGQDGPAVYQFQYTTRSLTRGCPNHDLNLASDVTVPLLTGVTLPDGSSYTVAPADYLITTMPGTVGFCTFNSGAILGLTLPTLGRIEWTYQTYGFPANSSSKPARQRNPGVATRTTKDARGNVLGQWTYTTALTPDPGGGFPREAVNTVTDPAGTRVERHFSVSTQDLYTATDWTVYDYGAQFTRYTVAGQPAGWYLAERTYENTGRLLRTGYSVFERDPAVAGHSGSLPDAGNVNRRLLKSRTVYEDDGGTYADLVNSNFDGLGHFRAQQTMGNFPGSNVRTRFTNYNPGQGTLTPNPSTNQIQPGFTMLAASAAWALPTYTFQWDAENGATAFTEYCFYPNSVVVSRRRVHRLDGAAQDSADLLTIYGKDGAGNLSDESSYGGDLQAVLPTGGANVCTVAPTVAPEYSVHSVWTKGALASSQYANAPFLSVDRTIDAATGLVLSSRDTAKVQTSYSYDALGRLTFSQTGTSAPTVYTYTPATSPSALARLHVEQQPAGVPASLRPQRDLSFDDFGRLVREEVKMPNGSVSPRTYAYDALGRRTAVSEPGNPGLLTQTAYDPFNRPTAITTPDGHTATISYSGVRQVARTVSLGEQYDATRGTVREFPQTTTEVYDRQSRLLQVTEPLGGGVPTTYGYDVGNRLVQVSTTALVSGANVTQTRSWSYDRRGFLQSETHPEKGLSGNGAVSYFSYDSRGHATRRLDGPNDLTMSFDSAERLTQVRRTGTSGACTAGGTNCWKFFIYGTANGGSDLRLGKLVSAQRWNFPVIGGATHVERLTTSYTYAGRDGRLSQRDLTLASDGDTTPGAHEAFTQSWAYDDQGHLQTETYPTCAFTACTGSTSRTVTSTYTAGFLTALSPGTGTVPGQAAGVGITYAANGLVSQVAHANGVVWTQLPDKNGMARPGGFTSSIGGATYWSTGGYNYDGAGNVTQVGSSYYLYDNVSRIGTASFSTLALDGGTPTVQGYSYDPFGNLTALSGANGRNLPTSPQTNRLNAPGTTYDAAGNLKSWNGAFYEYDGLNELVHYVNGSEEWLYLYDADDERAWSFKVGASPRFDRWTLRGLDAQVRRDYEVSGFGWSNWSSGNTWEDLVYRGGSLLASYYSPGQQRHFDNDHLGSPRLLTNFGAAQVAYHAYYPFGEEATAFNQDVERLKFTGHERDLASAAGSGDDLDYMHARHFGPVVGRFLGVDPTLKSIDAFRPQSWNRYSYVRNRPMTYVDPTGKILVFSGSSEDLAKLQALVNSSLSGYQLVLSKNGTASLVSTSDKATKQTGLAQALSTAINRSEVVRIGVVSGDPSVLIGQYATGKIDIQDIATLGRGSGINSGAALAHEVTEQTAKQVFNLQNVSDGESIAHNFGLSAQEQASGFSRLSSFTHLDSTNSGITMSFLSNDDREIAVTLLWVDGNLVKVTREQP